MKDLKIDTSMYAFSKTWVLFNLKKKSKGDEIIFSSMSFPLYLKITDNQIS